MCCGSNYDDFSGIWTIDSSFSMATLGSNKG